MKTKIPALLIPSLLLLLLSSCKGGSDLVAQNQLMDSTITADTTAFKPIQYDSSKKYIYLTLDDGPQPPGTNICKNIFETEGVKATFFLVGMHQFDERRKRIVDTFRNNYPQFLIANHSFTHGFRNKYKSFYSNPDSAVKDFMRAEAELKLPVKIIRLPGNNAWVGNGEIRGPKQVLPLCHKLDSLGYSVIGWDVEWQFINKGGSIPLQSVDNMLRNINKKFSEGTTNRKDHLVILAHDRMFEKAQYADSLRKLVSILKQNPHYTFETVDHYPIVQDLK